MTVEVFKKLGSKDQYEYLRDLEYQPCNLPNVGVHYGDVRAICVNKRSSAYISEGDTKSFTQQHNNKIVIIVRGIRPPPFSIIIIFEIFKCKRRY